MSDKKVTKAAAPKAAATKEVKELSLLEKIDNIIEEIKAAEIKSEFTSLRAVCFNNLNSVKHCVTTMIE